jgi:hypothetical protein
MVCPCWAKPEKNHTVRCVKEEDATKFGAVFIMERFILEL